MPAAGKAVDSALPEFSLVEGGPLHGLMRRVRIGGRPIGPVGFGVALALLTWLPLLCLVVLERVGPGPGQPGSFLASINTHVRFLVAIPLMFFAEVWIDPRLRHFVQDLVVAGLVTGTETPALTRAVRLTHRIRDSVAAELGLAILALTLVQLDVRPFTPARRRRVLAIDRRRGGRPADVGGVVVRPGGAPRLSVPDLPVGLAPPRVGGVPLATLPRAPAAHAHAPGSGGGPRIPPGRAGPLRDPLHGLLGGGRRHLRRAHDVRGRASGGADPPADHACRREPGALPRAAVLLRPAAAGGQAPRSARVRRPRHRLRPCIRRQVAPGQDPGGRAPPRKPRHPIAQ